jgi:hypothetical protein
LPWDFKNNINGTTGAEAGLITVAQNPGFNGGVDNAVDVTWKGDPATATKQWGGPINLPGDYEEAWFTLDFQYSADFSPGTTSQGGKMPGLTAGRQDPGNARPPSGGRTPDCAGGWGARHMWRQLNGDGTLKMEQYIYDTDKDPPWEHGRQVGFSESVARGVPHTLEQRIKLNSGANNFDGIDETKLDGVLVASTTNLRMYCATEANRASARVSQIEHLPFYGGSTTAWSPVVDSTITFGNFKVEIPN